MFLHALIVLFAEGSFLSTRLMTFLANLLKTLCTPLTSVVLRIS